jgi:ribosomal protein L25 (general stress protein Ctc)
MSNINHKNVYELHEYEQAIFAAERKVREAEQTIDIAKKLYRKKCSDISGVPELDLEFSNCVCIAKGIAYHVYHIKLHHIDGSSENKCIFCGCDNFN